MPRPYDRSRDDLAWLIMIGFPTSCLPSWVAVSILLAAEAIAVKIQTIAQQ